MPQRKRARRKSAKASKRRARQAEQHLSAMRSHVLQMEEPLRETGNLIRALCLMGDGLHYTGDEDEARAISAVAWTTLRNARLLQDEWNRLVEAGSRR